MATVFFTYYVYHKPTKKKYYGVRYRKGCHPNELWTTYFTSSKLVKTLIKEYGVNSFDVEIRKIFSTAAAAKSWESKVHRRLKVNLREDWLNQHVQGERFYCSGHSIETRNKIRQKMTGRVLSDEHRQRISKKSLLDRKRRQESGWRMPRDAVERMRLSNIGRKHAPEGIERMRETKKGKVRHYRTDGSFYMDYP